MEQCLVRVWMLERFMVVEEVHRALEGPLPQPDQDGKVDDVLMAVDESNKEMRVEMRRL